MPRQRFLIPAFNAGELTPLLNGRADQDKYHIGCDVLRNFILTVQGPARRRGGTRHVGLVKDSTKPVWLTDFTFSLGQAYLLEFGDRYVRFWTNRGQLLDGSAPYEVATPWSAEDLTTAEGTFALRMVQSADVMWIVHVDGKTPAYKLSRLGATNWTLAEDVIEDGPFRDVNTDNAKQMYASAATGAVTITSTTAEFLPGHVGSMILLFSMDPSKVTPYQPALDVTIGDIVRNGGNVYEALGSYSYDPDDTAQRYVPTHTEGDANDGRVTWRYLHSGYGWGRITSVAGDGLSCVVNTISRFPAETIGNSNKTRRWAFSEFSSVYGWPTGVDFFKERLTYVRGRELFHSVVGDFASFKRRDAGQVTSETAIVLRLAANRLDKIRWIAPSRQLLIGSARGEAVVGEQTTQQVYSATNVQHTPQTEYGARMIRPLRVGESVLFVERAGHRVRDMRFDFSIDRYKAEDITVLSEHLFDGSDDGFEADPRSIVDWTYQQQRDSLVWCVLSNGELALLVHNRDRGVLAWAPVDIGGGGFVETAQSVVSPDGTADDLWLVVRRTVNGQVQRSVEYMTDYRLSKRGVGEAVHVDNSVTYRGTPKTTITGLSHLEGETVQVLADGSNEGARVVSGGAITLDKAASLVHVGYQFVSRARTMDLELAAGDGTAQAARKAASSIFLRVQATIGGMCGVDFSRLSKVKSLDPRDPVGVPRKLFTGDVEITPASGFETSLRVCYEQSDPFPATLVAIIVRAQINA